MLAVYHFNPAALVASPSTMEAVTPSFQTLIIVPRSSIASRERVKDNKQARQLVEKCRCKFASLKVGGLPRRMLLYIGFIPLLSNANRVLAAPIQEMKEPEIIRTRNLPGGVRVQDIVQGEGAEAGEGDLVEFNYVCRRSNGYFVYSTVDQFSGEAKPVVLPLDENQIIKGLKDVLMGMKIGGKRRALIPPSMGYIHEDLQPIPDEFGPRRSLMAHANDPLVFEVQLLKIL